MWRRWCQSEPQSQRRPRAQHYQSWSDQPCCSRRLHGGLLSLKGVARRVIGAVDVRVAIRARAPQDESCALEACPARFRRMPRLDVALLGEARLGELQHLLVVRAVGVVAVRAILVDGRVGIEEGAALLSVAFVARLG